MILPTESVQCPLPANCAPGEAPLFAPARRRILPAVAEPPLRDVDLLASGHVCEPGSLRVVDEHYQDGRHRGLGAMREFGHVMVQRLRSARVSWTPTATPLVVTDEYSASYFHWLADCLPKLQFLQPRLQDFELVLPAYALERRYIAESLAAWPQLRVRVLAAREMARLANTLLMPRLAPSGEFRPAVQRELARALRARWAPASPPARLRKIYISRARARNRRLCNEAVAAALLADAGFETVFMEEMGLAAQVALMAQTSHLVSNHGAGLANMMFMQPGARVLELRRAGDGGHHCFLYLAQAMNLAYYVCHAPASGSPRAPQNADVTVDPAALASALRQFAP